MIAGKNIRVVVQGGGHYYHFNVQPPDTNDTNGTLTIFNLKGEFVRCYGSSYCYIEEIKNERKIAELRCFHKDEK